MAVKPKYGWDMEYCGSTLLHMVFNSVFTYKYLCASVRYPPFSVTHRIFTMCRLTRQHCSLCYLCRSMLSCNICTVFIYISDCVLKTCSQVWAYEGGATVKCQCFLLLILCFGMQWTSHLTWTVKLTCSERQFNSYISNANEIKISSPWKKKNRLRM